MEHFSTRVISNHVICNGYYSMRLSWPSSVPGPLPGQFLTIRPPVGTGALLRRPFAFSAVDDKESTVEIVYERRGDVTRFLATCRNEEMLDLLAPLGTPFPDPQTGTRPVLLAGGIGMGPVFFLASALRKSGLQPLLVLGARNASLIPDRPLFREVETIIATDDGSAGFHGTSVDALLSYERSHKLADVEYFACGPMPMLRSLAAHAESHKRQCWVSIEQTMGCAVGACMGCVIPVHGEGRYARVCTEGPVFDARAIVWT
ncbi:MAG: dihydroorotate dehydrogenase electron transfer subunit [Spirochaetota bacterium]